MKYKIEVIDKYNHELLDDLVALEKEAFGYGGLNKWQMVPIINHGKVFVLYDSDKVIGLCEVLRDFDNLYLVYIFSLAIKSEYKNQGLGSKLFKYVLEWLRDKEINEVELTVNPENEAACYMYKDKFAFKEVEYREAEYGRDEPRLVMKLSL
jgi:ribosomal-protein-alanine N-acetyltransferase